MGLFKRKEERTQPITEFEDALLQSLLSSTTITKAVARQIPTISGAVGLIGDIVASTPIKLYREIDGRSEEVKGDPRVKLLNDSTGDTLNAHDFWKAIVADYWLGKGGYAYIRKEKNKFVGIHYTDETYVAIQTNNDPIFKDYDILVNGQSYKPYDFVKILRNSKDGASGTPLTAENSTLMEVVYETLKFEANLVKKGGNKKGFLKSETKLDEPAMTLLKAAWARLYGNTSSENVVVLNKGMDFTESSNTSVEMQMNENKKTNSDEIGKLFRASSAIISGTAKDEDISSFTKLVILPLMKTIECALNCDFLLEKEKGSLYWAFDTKELLKGTPKERFEAHGLAVDKGIMTRNEVRFAEDLPAIAGLDVISWNLGDVIYDVKTKKYFTPNTKLVTDTNGKPEPPVTKTEEGGENI